MIQILQTLQANDALFWFALFLAAVVVFFVYYARGEARKLALKLLALIIDFIGGELTAITQAQVYEAAAWFYKRYLPVWLRGFIALGFFQELVWAGFKWLCQTVQAPELDALRLKLPAGGRRLKGR